MESPANVNSRLVEIEFQMGNTTLLSNGSVTLLTNTIVNAFNNTVKNNVLNGEKVKYGTLKMGSNHRKSPSMNAYLSTNEKLFNDVSTSPLPGTSVCNKMTSYIFQLWINMNRDTMNIRCDAWSNMCGGMSRLGSVPGSRTVLPFPLADMLWYSSLLTIFRIKTYNPADAKNIVPTWNHIRIKESWTVAGAESNDVQLCCYMMQKGLFIYKNDGIVLSSIIHFIH